MALLACASAGVENVQRFADDGTMARPVSLLVYDFATDADQALEDTFGAGSDSQALSAEEQREARAVARHARTPVRSGQHKTRER